MKRKIFIRIFSSKLVHSLQVLFYLLILQGCRKDPKASFYSEFQHYGINEDVIFVNQSKDANSYYWDFGDGTSSVETSPSKYYPFAGEYIIRLSAFSKNRKVISSTKHLIEVGNKVSLDIDSIKEGGRVLFQPKTIGRVKKFTLEIFKVSNEYLPDNNSMIANMEKLSTNKIDSLVFTFNASGYHSITLITEFENGEKIRINKVENVLPADGKVIWWVDHNNRYFIYNIKAKVTGLNYEKSLSLSRFNEDLYSAPACETISGSILFNLNNGTYNLEMTYSDWNKIRTINYPFTINNDCTIFKYSN